MKEVEEVLFGVVRFWAIVAFVTGVHGLVLYSIFKAVAWAVRKIR